jgi:hypothetical protein
MIKFRNDSRRGLPIIIIIQVAFSLLSICCFMGLLFNRGNNLEMQIVSFIQPMLANEILVSPSGKVLNWTQSLPSHSAPCIDIKDSNTFSCLPSFSIAGMPKSGSSALHWYLSQYPKLSFMPKELCAVGASKKANSYDTYFSMLPDSEKLCKDCLVGETCISMGMQLATATAYRAAVPTIKDVFLLVRNPIDHMYASYWFWCTWEETNMPLEMCKSTSARWNPRKNVIYVDESGVEKWYDFPRSPSDFHQRVTRALAEGCQSIACSDFVFRNHKNYISNLHAIYNQGLHLLSTELLYSETEAILNRVVSILGLPPHDFSEISKYSINVNGNPGTDTVQEKSRGDYPPMLQATRDITAEAVKEVAKYAESISGIDFFKIWSGS